MVRNPRLVKRHTLRALHIRRSFLVICSRMLFPAADSNLLVANLFSATSEPGLLFALLGYISWLRLMAACLGRTSWSHVLATRLSNTYWPRLFSVPLDCVSWPRHLAASLSLLRVLLGLVIGPYPSEPYLLLTPFGRASCSRLLVAPPGRTYWPRHSLSLALSFPFNDFSSTFLEMWRVFSRVWAFLCNWRPSGFCITLLLKRLARPRM